MLNTGIKSNIKENSILLDTTSINKNLFNSGKKNMPSRTNFEFEHLLYDCFEKENWNEEQTGLSNDSVFSDENTGSS